MNTFASTVPMRGWRAGVLLVLGLIELGVSTYLVMNFPDGAGSELAGAFALFLTIAGVCSTGWAIWAAYRRVVWIFEADAQRVVWYRTDRSGEIRERSEIAVADVVAVIWDRSSEVPGLWLKVRTGAQFSLGEFVSSASEFTDWVSAHYEGVPVTVT